MDDSLKKISPSDLAEHTLNRRSGDVPAQATPTMTMVSPKPGARPPAPIESVRFIGGQRRSSTEPEPCPYGFCDGSGWYKHAVPYGHDHFSRLFRCDCQRLSDVERRREKVRLQLCKLEDGMGGELAGAMLDNYDLGRASSAKNRATMAAARDVCRAYVDSPMGWLYIYGPTGVGKSHLAAATARALISAYGLTFAYVSEPDMMKWIRDGWGKTGDDSDDARITALQDAELLVLDDLGTEPRGKNNDVAYVDSKLLALSMPRYQHDRFTIITSNLPIDAIDEPRLRSRIKGRANEDYSGRNQVLLVTNADQREGGKR